MTGELCDCFETKRDGVWHILAAVAAVFPNRRVRAWSTGGQFLSLDDASRSSLSVAAGNWHALATFVGPSAGPCAALLIDTGSTTTDIIPIFQMKPIPCGFTDPDRMRFGELVYSGAARTPVCAVVGQKVAGELFATTLDVYLRLGMIPEDPGNCATADGRPATAHYSHGRLSRMLGGDPEITSPAETQALATQAFEAQSAFLSQAVQDVGSRLPAPPRRILVSGSGEFLARKIGEATYPDAEVVSLSRQLSGEVASAACAFAIAVLASREAS
jgi:probable H4MPT-linked C1 transfer pathway protein